MMRSVWRAGSVASLSHCSKEPGRTFPEDVTGNPQIRFCKEQRFSLVSKLEEEPTYVLSRGFGLDFPNLCRKRRIVSFSGLALLQLAKTHKVDVVGSVCADDIKTVNCGDRY